MGCWTPPFGNPQVSLARSPWPNSSPLRGWSFGAVGEGRERVRARPDRRTSTASVLGASPPGPPRFPAGRRLPVMRACWGLTPPCPPGSQTGKVCLSCALVGDWRPLAPRFPNGKSLLVMRERAWYRVRNGFCGNAFASLRGSSCRAAARSSVTSLARLCRRHSSATAVGGFQRGNAFGLLFCLLFCRSRKVGARRGPSASKGKDKNLIGVKRIKKEISPRANCVRSTRQRDRRGNPKGGAALFGQSLPTFCWSESRGPARPERVEGKR